MNRLETICYNEADNSITIIDQTKLPNALVYKTLVSSQDVYHAIKDLEVRGAPLIGITAAYGLLMERAQCWRPVGERSGAFLHLCAF